MSKEFLYDAFGLILKTTFKIPELLKVVDNTTEIDVNIYFGNILDFPKELIDGWYKVLSNELFLEIEDVARFKILNGNEIIIDSFPKIDNDNLRLYLLGSAMAGILHQRKFLPLHASAVLVKGKAVLFSADSGFGKSTLCMGFQSKGYEVISDDVCCFYKTDNNLFKLNSGYPQLKLWKESVELFQEVNSETLVKVRQGEDKFRINVKENFKSGPVVPKAIFFLELDERDDVEISEMDSMDSILCMQNNVFRPFFVDEKEDLTNNFKNIVSIIQKTKVYKLSRPKNGISIDVMIDEVLKTIK